MRELGNLMMIRSKRGRKGPGYKGIHGGVEITRNGRARGRQGKMPLLLQKKA